MCLGIPRRVVARHEHGVAEVEAGTATQRVSTQMLDPSEGDVAPGDWVVVHMGLALARVDEAEAAQLLAEMAALEAAFDDALEAVEER